MSRIFNRKDTAVIAAALNSTKEEFVKQYSETTASVVTLEKAYDEINGNKTKSKIAVQSGDGSPSEPLKPVHYALDEDGEVKKVDATDIPTRTDLEGVEFNEDGTVKKGTVTETPTAEKKTSEKAKKNAATKKTTATPKDATQGPSKRDVIRDLIAETPGISNKEIKAILAEKGYKCYDSEIAAVKNK